MLSQDEPPTEIINSIGFRVYTLKIFLVHEVRVFPVFPVTDCDSVTINLSWDEILVHENRSEDNPSYPLVVSICICWFRSNGPSFAITLASASSLLVTVFMPYQKPEKAWVQKHHTYLS